MDRPLITIHNTVSVDGRLTGFPVDLGLHYDIAGRLPAAAVLTGSDTLLAAAEAEGIDLTAPGPGRAEFTPSGPSAALAGDRGQPRTSTEAGMAAESAVLA